MKPNTNSWYHKVFVFNSQIVATMREYQDPHLHPHHGKMYGLCPYMRMIFVWGPIVFLMNLFPLLCLIGTAIVLPITIIGGVSTAYTALVILAVIGIILACIWLLEYTSEILKKRRYQQKQVVKQREKDGVVPPDTFWSLTKAYLKSAKTKVCPVLEFDDER
jgi:hypothetical protein